MFIFLEFRFQPVRFQSNQLGCLERDGNPIDEAVKD